jgi:hypothetical protein
MPLHLWACKAADNCRVWRTQQCHVLCHKEHYGCGQFQFVSESRLFWFNMLHLVLCFKLCTKWRQDVYTHYSTSPVHTPLITYWQLMGVEAFKNVHMWSETIQI